MKHFMCAIQVIVIAIGIYMIVAFPAPGTPPFMSGISFTLIGTYLMLQSCGHGSCKCKKKKA